MLNPEGDKNNEDIDRHEDKQQLHYVPSNLTSSDDEIIVNVVYLSSNYLEGKCTESISLDARTLLVDDKYLEDLVHSIYRLFSNTSSKPIIDTSGVSRFASWQLGNTLSFPIDLILGQPEEEKPMTILRTKIIIRCLQDPDNVLLQSIGQADFVMIYATSTSIFNKRCPKNPPLQVETAFRDKCLEKLIETYDYIKASQGPRLKDLITINITGSDLEEDRERNIRGKVEKDKNLGRIAVLKYLGSRDIQMCYYGDGHGGIGVYHIGWGQSWDNDMKLLNKCDRYFTEKYW